MLPIDKVRNVQLHEYEYLKIYCMFQISKHFKHFISIQLKTKGQEKKLYFLIIGGVDERGGLIYLEGRLLGLSMGSPPFFWEGSNYYEEAWEIALFIFLLLIWCFEKKMFPAFLMWM